MKTPGYFQNGPCHFLVFSSVFRWAISLADLALADLGPWPLHYLMMSLRVRVRVRGKVMDRVMCSFHNVVMHLWPHNDETFQPTLRVFQNYNIVPEY